LSEDRERDVSYRRGPDARPPRGPASLSPRAAAAGTLAGAYVAGLVLVVAARFVVGMTLIGQLVVGLVGLVAAEWAIGSWLAPGRSRAARSGRHRIASVVALAVLAATGLLVAAAAPEEWPAIVYVAGVPIYLAAEWLIDFVPVRRPARDE
jgi:hypothetical protein